jgi:hypothetical protein
MGKSSNLVHLPSALEDGESVPYSEGGCSTASQGIHPEGQEQNLILLNCSR